MNSGQVDKLVAKRVGWLADCGPDDDISISTRIRLARNLLDFPFPIQADEAVLKSVALGVKTAVRDSGALKSPVVIEMEDISDVDGGVLVERRLISGELLQRPVGAALLLDGEESLSVMVNEEDHLRLQTIRPGLALSEAWNAINEMDDRISSGLNFAFDPFLGFLTSCPTNVGTGMRASVMLHLPALALTGHMDTLTQGVAKLGLAVRGMFGEGTGNLGNICQISNQSTLGESEEDILKRLNAVITQVVNHEKNARSKLLETRENFLLDSVGRAYGTLKYAYSISSQEALNSLSMLRLGVDLGLVKSVDIHDVNELFILVQPAHLQKNAGKILSSKERDEVRASILRSNLRRAE